MDRQRSSRRAATAAAASGTAEATAGNGPKKKKVQDTNTTTTHSSRSRSTRASAAAAASNDSGSSSSASSGRPSSTESSGSRKAEAEHSRGSGHSSNGGHSANGSVSSGATDSESSREGLPPHSLRDIQAEITRCVCGYQDIQSEEEFDDEGFYVQCDRCAVWQHGFCVGFRHTRDVPEHYYCELCRPDLHTVFQRGRHPKQSRFNTSALIAEYERLKSGASKKRSTMNSRNLEFEDGNFSNLEFEKPSQEHSASTDVRSMSKSIHSAPAAFLSAHSQQEHRQRSESPISSAGNRKRTRTRTSSSPVDVQQGINEHPQQKAGPRSTPKRRKTAANVASEDQAGYNVHNVGHQRRGTKASLASAKKAGLQINANGSETESIITTDDVESVSTEAEQKTGSATNSRSAHGRRTRGTTGASRSLHERNMRNGTQRSPQKEVLSAHDRPSRPRLPQPRTTLEEMQRRVSAILEYIGRLQLDLAQDQKLKMKIAALCNETVEDATNGTLPESPALALKEEPNDGNLHKSGDNTDGHASSTGSAVSSMLQFQSLELMENLTNKLLRWEEKFGRASDTMQHEREEPQELHHDRRLI